MYKRQTLRSNANYDNQDKTRRFLHGDLLTVSLGYKGWVQMKSPVMIPGKYKVTLRYFYANSMKTVSYTHLDVYKRQTVY